MAGTVLADLQMRIDGSVGLDLGDKTESLCAHLSALLALETLGKRQDGSPDCMNMIKLTGGPVDQ